MQHEINFLFFKTQTKTMPKKFSKTFIVLTISAVAFAPLTRAEETNTQNLNAQNTDAQAALQSVLANQKYPLSIRLQDLDASWRRFVLSDSTGTMVGMPMQVWGAAAGLELGVHFTKGEIVSIGENSYLVAYQLPVKIDRRFLNWHGHGPAPRPRKPDGETVLHLSLLNMKSISSLNDVRPFDPKTDMSNDKQSRADSVRTLEQLGKGVLRYIRARGKFPVLNNPINWNTARVFYPYVGDERLFMHPGTQEMYRYNAILGGKKAAHIPNKQSFVMFYEAAPAEDETRAALFMDGHVERLAPAHWEAVKRASKIVGDSN
jgi:hypothetical protein